MTTAKDINSALRSLGFTVVKRKVADSWVVMRGDEYVGEHRISVSYSGHTFHGTSNHRGVLGVYGPDYLKAKQGPGSAPSLTGDFREVISRGSKVADCRAECRAKWGEVAEWYITRLNSLLT